MTARAAPALVLSAARDSGTSSTDDKTNGLKDLSTRPKRQEEDGNVHCYNVIWKFDGTQYQKAKIRECECKAEGGKCTAWSTPE